MRRLFPNILIIIFILFLSFNTSKIIYASVTPNIYKVDFASPRVYEGCTQSIDIYTKANSKIQYKFWLYSKEDDLWQELTTNYTNAQAPEKAFTFTIPKLKFGQYTLSIWVKTADKDPINKNGYDNYYAYNFLCSHYDGQFYNRSLDKIKTEKPYIPSIERVVAQVPYLQAGNFQTFQVFSKGFEDVQYRVWLNNKNQNTWVELTSGYVEPQYAQSVYSISTPNLSLGDYTLSLWIKRANKQPLNVKGYDDYVSFNFNCNEKSNESNITHFTKLKNNYELNEKIEFTNIPETKKQYRYSIFDALNNKLIIPLSDYKNNVTCGPLKEGVYILQLDIKTFTEIKVDKDPALPDIQNSDLDSVQPSIDEKKYEYKRVETINKLIVFGKPYKKSTGKFIYLTFDDGPSTNVTPKILDILDKYDIKATFFVTGINADAHNDLIKQIYKRGHVIANHSYSHNYSKIYANVTSLIGEIEKTYNIIKKIIPTYNTKIFRFPGGSQGKDDSLKLAVMKDNYTYYDWDALNGDAEGYLVSKDKLISRIKETLNPKSSAIVLMHDSNVKTTTVDALPTIIEYLINSGYEFKTL
ncbi:polysaccharide deacetylase [Clostridium estertheticum]|uniref:polysaccharide deacetylase family protein n=1 Tax=Clostridium estertheticum TaxID=238834 RepID=UPI0013E975B5|nr:polysaccharide deacetylase family protein [Clostridium estertheticum]MBZ9688794.1 polysaccharide deacetylase [Clostridium estertheticum]